MSDISDSNTMRVRIIDLDLVEEAGADAKLLIETEDGTRIIELGKIRAPRADDPTWTSVQNKPTTFPAAPHTHPVATTSQAGFMTPGHVQRLQDVEGYALDGVIDCGIG